MTTMTFATVMVRVDGVFGVVSCYILGIEIQGFVLHSYITL